MNLDAALKNAITQACTDEGVESAAPSIVRFIERHISNELQGQQFGNTLDSIYELLKAKDNAC